MQKNSFRILLVLMLVLAVTVSMAVAQGGGAGGQGGGGRGGGGGGGQGGGGRGGRGGGGIPAMPITTAAFADGTDIPAKYTGQMGVSPELNWTPPMGAMIASYVLIMHDVDAANPAGSFGGDITHWVTWHIPGTATKLAENIPTGATLMDGSHQANNIAGSAKYFGPSPPAGAPYHHYIFQLYGLNAMLDLPATATRADIEKAMEGKIVARSGYVGKVKGS